jgi:alginate O-acetyltransferase complex protein AlgJ
MRTPADLKVCATDTRRGRSATDTRNRRSAGLQACLVVAIISLPIVANLAGMDGADPASENRTLASFPVLDQSWRSVAGFGSGLSDWFEDHFGFRAMLVRWYARSRFFVLDTSPSPTVAVGSDGWLFFADDGAIEDYTNERALPPGEVAAWKESVNRAREWLRRRGIAYLFTIAPDKHAIYPERMPPSIRRVGSVSRVDQVLDAVSAADVVDLRAPLESGKARERLYHRTDTHWNDRGAFIAYTAMIDAVRRQNPAVPPPWPRSDFQVVSRVVAGRDLAGMIGLTRVLAEEDLELVPTRPRLARVVEPAGAASSAELGRIVTEIPGSKLPRAVVFRDSFASALAPFLSEHFSRVVYLWQNDFDAQSVLDEKPAVVIQEIVGRHLYTFTPTPDLVPQN